MDENSEIKNFIVETRKFQTLFANLEGFSCPKIVNVKEKELLFNVLLGYCNNGKEMKFTQTQILKHAVSKLISIHKKYNQSDEICFTFSWIYYFIHNKKLTKKFGVCEILNTGSKNRVFLNLVNLNTYNSWDEVLGSINSPGSLVCAPSNGLYITSEKKPIIELEYFCLRKINSRSFLPSFEFSQLGIFDIFETCEPYSVGIKKWWSELNLEALWRELKEDLMKRNIWEKFLKAFRMYGVDFIVFFLKLKFDGNKALLECVPMLLKLVNSTENTFNWETLIDGFLRQSVRECPRERILSNFISSAFDMFLVVKKLLTGESDYETFLLSLSRFLELLSDLKFFFPRLAGIAELLKFLIFFMKKIPYNALEATPNAVETTAVDLRGKVYLKIQENLLDEVIVPHLKSLEVESREYLVAKNWDNFCENFLKRNEKTPMTDSDGEIFKDHKTGFQFHIFKKNLAEINELVESLFGKRFILKPVNNKLLIVYNCVEVKCGVIVLFDIEGQEYQIAVFHSKNFSVKK